MEIHPRKGVLHWGVWGKFLNLGGQPDWEGTINKTHRRVGHALPNPSLPPRSHGLPSGFHGHHSIQTILPRGPMTSKSPNLMVQCSSFQQNYYLPLNELLLLFPGHHTCSAFLLLGWCSFSSLFGCFLFFQISLITNVLWS